LGVLNSVKKYSIKVILKAALIGALIFALAAALFIPVIPPQWLVEALGRQTASAVAQHLEPPLGGAVIGGLIGLLGVLLAAWEQSWRGHLQDREKKPQ